MTTKFKIGDKVRISSWRDEFTATVLAIGDRFPELPGISARQTYILRVIAIRGAVKGHVYDNLSYAEDSLEADNSWLTKEQRINLRIKTLWNESRYVQKNPQTAIA